MNRPVFYAPDIERLAELPEEEARHCSKVLRMTEGDALLLTDGRGSFYRACLSNVHPKHCRVDVLEKIPAPLPWSHTIHIALAPTKNSDRMEWFVEKATEIGVNDISFLHCRFSERKGIKIDRMEKIAISAMKQSQKAVLPALHEMQSFKQFIGRERAGQRFIAHCYPGDKLPLKEAYRPGDDATLLIGPEGDFSEEEVAEAIQAGYQPVSLGEARLRTETAALVACHTIQLFSYPLRGLK